MQASMGSRRAIALMGVAGSLALAGLGAGCGDDGDVESGSATSTTSTATADAGQVTVTAKEYSFDLSATPAADTEEIVFDNVGEEFHVMIFARINEGFTVEDAIRLEGEKGSAEIVAETSAEPGTEKTAKVRGPLKAGDYAMLCPVAGKQGPHFQLGQLEEFSIE
ncbi:MAG: hypothetical protein ABW249_09395 [Solirubrobacterales bacterium]